VFLIIGIGLPAFSLLVCRLGGKLVAFQQSLLVRYTLFDVGIVNEHIYLAAKPNGAVMVGATKADWFDPSVTIG
jgi:hypothetical protein